MRQRGAQQLQRRAAPPPRPPPGRARYACADPSRWRAGRSPAGTRSAAVPRGWRGGGSQAGPSAHPKYAGMTSPTEMKAGERADAHSPGRLLSARRQEVDGAPRPAGPRSGPPRSRTRARRRGCCTVAMSPTFLPMSARATGRGDGEPALLDVGLQLSDDPVRDRLVGLRCRAASRWRRRRRSPPLSLLVSITSARAIQSLRSRMRPSMWDCFSLAAWYSAFSFRSPWARATSISLEIFPRSTDWRCLSSSLSFRRP